MPGAVNWAVNAKQCFSKNSFRRRALRSLISSHTRLCVGGCRWLPRGWTRTQTASSCRHLRGRKSRTRIENWPRIQRLGRDEWVLHCLSHL